MNNKEKIILETKNCVNEAATIILFLQEKLDEEKQNTFFFHLEYQKWYSKAIKVIEYLGKERLQEFKSYYEIDPKRKNIGYGTYVIQDYIKNVVPNKFNYPDFDSKQQTIQNVYNQYSILHAIYDRIDNIIVDIQSALFIEFQDLELETSKSLLKVNLRASGVIAGVILESHLKRIVDKHKIKLTKKNPTLSDFNEILKSNSIYDTTIWRKLSYLGDIRNLCAHKKDKDPQKEQIEELIDGVHWVIKNIF